MNQYLRKFITNGVEVSRKILCLLLACLLIIQAGCQTTKVLITMEKEDLKARDQQPLKLKKGQLVRITYLDGSVTKTKRLAGWIKSVTSEAIIMVIYHTGYGNKDVRISFKHIKKIELVEQKMSTAGYVATATFVLLLYFFINLDLTFD